MNDLNQLRLEGSFNWSVHWRKKNRRISFERRSFNFYCDTYKLFSTQNFNTLQDKTKTQRKKEMNEFISHIYLSPNHWWSCSFLAFIYSSFLSSILFISFMFHLYYYYILWLIELLVIKREIIYMNEWLTRECGF